jgi:tetratricopeptide (TPR) repeat protein
MSLVGNDTQSSELPADETVKRLRAAHATAPALETEQALARLQSKLFGSRAPHPVLDRYALIRKLGQGGAGVVHLAYDPRLDRKVAIKLLHPHRHGDGATDGEARLMREAQAMARSPHPNVVAVYDVGTYEAEALGGAGVFVVMEYVEGPTLHTWLKRSHPWRRVLEVFIAAGRGLAAAHGVGVTHRDFKPANVIVADDSRVRVLDFGLARGGEREEEEPSVEQSLRSRDDISLDASLTVEGTILGTPAFMPPEQHDGRETDPSSDQYSFCVSLWTGLYGHKPFEGQTLADLAWAKQSTRPRAPEDADVPKWIQPILQRGLSVDPDQRWESMDALLAELEQGLSRGRSRQRMLVAAMLGIPVLGGLWAVAGRSAPACVDRPERIDALWNDARRATVDQAFNASGSGNVDRAREAMNERLDAFVESWAAEYRSACEATHVLGEQSAELLDLRVACLDRRLRDVDALVSLFEDADAPTVDRAHLAMSSLPRPATCSDVERLLAGVAPPEDPEVGRAVEGIRADLARVRALGIAGKMQDALILAQTVARRASTVDYPPVVAEALESRGRLEERNARYEEAVETMTQAHSIAVAAGHDKIAADAAQVLAWIYGEHRNDLDRALQWADIAQAQLDRIGLGHDNARILETRAAAYRVAGDFDRASETLLQTIAAVEQQDPPDDFMLAVLHNDAGDVLRELAKYDEARHHLEEAIAILERLFGPDDASVAAPINTLGAIDLSAHDWTGAEAKFRRALDLRSRSLGTKHPRYALTLMNLGTALRNQHRYADSAAAFEQALKIFGEQPEPNEDHISSAMMSLGNLYATQELYAESEPWLVKALARSESFLPADHPNLAFPLANLAATQRMLGKHELADESYRRALEIRIKAFGADHPHVARTRLAHARAMYKVGLTERARSEAQVARSELAGGSDPKLAEEIDTWLEEHP